MSIEEINQSTWLNGFTVRELINDNITTPARVHTKDKLIEIKKPVLETATNNELYLLIRWCINRVLFEPHNYSEADKLTIEDCLKSGMHKKEILNIYVKFLINNACMLNEDRVRKLAENLKKIDL